MLALSSGTLVSSDLQNLLSLWLTCSVTCKAYRPIYISVVKISVDGGKHFFFFQFNALKVFNAINVGAELVVATPFTTAALVSLFVFLFSFFLSLSWL